MKTIATFLAFFVLIHFYTANAETRGEILELNDRSDFKYNMHARERQNDQNSQISNMMAGSKNLGFYEFNNSTMKSDPMAQAILSAYSKTSGFTGVLIVRIYCSIADSIIPVSPRNKMVKWSVKSQESEKAKQIKPSGDVQIDGEGFVRIKLNTSGGSSDRKIIFDILGNRQEIDLDQGPFEVFMPENVCKNSSIK